MIGHISYYLGFISCLTKAEYIHRFLSCLLGTIDPVNFRLERRWNLEMNSEDPIYGSLIKFNMYNPEHLLFSTEDEYVNIFDIDESDNTSLGKFVKKDLLTVHTNDWKILYNA